MKQQGVKARKDFLEDEDLQVRLEGFPPEVADALNGGSDWGAAEPGEHVCDAVAQGGLDALCRTHGGDMPGGVPAQGVDRAV